MSVIDKIKKKKTIEEYKKKSLLEGKYYLLADKKNQKLIEGSTEFYEMFKEWDEYGSIPLEVAKNLNSIMNENDYWLLGHRTAIFGEEDLESNNLLYDVLTNGLFNNGHTLSNGTAKVSVPPVTDTCDIIDNPLHLQIMLKTHRGDSFGNESRGTILLKIPKEYINEDGKVLVDQNLIYNYNDDNIPVIKPEFIIGVTTLNDENYKGECKYYSKEEILEKQKLDSKTK